MNEKNIDNGDKAIDLSQLDPCTIEDIIADNAATKSIALRIHPKGKESKMVRCTFRKLDIVEAIEIANNDLSAKGTDQYRRNLISKASVEPAFKDGTDESFEGVDFAFQKNYTDKINAFIGMNDFL